MDLTFGKYGFEIVAIFVQREIRNLEKTGDGMKFGMNVDTIGQEGLLFLHI